MGAAPKLSQFQVPLVAFRVQSPLTNPCQQRTILLYPLPTTGNLSITLRGQTICRQGDLRVRGIRHVIERLRLLWIMSDKERTIKLRGQKLLLLVSEIVTPLYPRLLFPDHLERLIVGDSLERWLHLLQIFQLPLEQSQLGLALFH